jgi:hypothetical protein
MNEREKRHFFKKCLFFSLNITNLYWHFFSILKKRTFLHNHVVKIEIATFINSENRWLK